MDATPNSHVGVFARHFGNALVVALQFGIGEISYRDGATTLGPNTVSMMPTTTPQMIAACECIGVALKEPARVALPGVVVVFVAVADRRNGPPKIISELRIPVADEGIGYPHVEQGEEAGVICEGE